MPSHTQLFSMQCPSLQRNLYLHFNYRNKENANLLLISQTDCVVKCYAITHRKFLSTHFLYTAIILVASIRAIAHCVAKLFLWYAFGIFTSKFVFGALDGIGQYQLKARRNYFISCCVHMYIYMYVYI